MVADVERFLRIAPRQSAFFSLDAGMEAAYGKLGAVRAEGGKVVFELKEGVADLPGRLAGFSSMVQSPKAFTTGEPFADSRSVPDRTRLASWSKGQQAVLTANPHSYGAAADYDTIVVRAIPDANARARWTG
uniref:Periplasmic dipeptide transport protein n=1 Tax=Nonomuraea gerenzanensis TaxID=93944 RepID=A0A1M4EMJ8_9ACTN|nr:periplasmic dipeptide transport protein precursor [Nonomuraea gerenzanensis]